MSNTSTPITVPVELDIAELENGIEKAEKLKRLLDEIKISIKEVKDLL